MVRRRYALLALVSASFLPACSLDTDALLTLWDGGPPDATPADAATDGGSDAGVEADVAPADGG